MLERRVRSFLESLGGGGWVLALSGGPDSMALFQILKKLDVSFVVAHVDHGWREESKNEGETLKKWVGEIPFFLKSFKKSDFKGNLEQAARLARLDFFKKVVQKTKSKGVLLAHHADDLAETVFKKILEGTPLYRLEAIKKVSEIDGLLVVRPLLDYTKKELLAYLGQIPYFHDETNLSHQFLRGRLRSAILPALSNVFGKQIEKPLVEIARDAHLLNDYLKETLAPYHVVSGPFGDYIDLTCPPHPFLLQALIHFLLKERSLPVFRGEIKNLCSAIQMKKAGFIQGQLIADRGFLFFLNPTKPALKDWELNPIREDLSLTGWKELWTGSAIGWAPDNNIWLGFGPNNYDKWWTNHKVPSFLRHYIPLLMSENGPVHEFLSGKRKGKDKGMKIRLDYKKQNHPFS